MIEREPDRKYILVTDLKMPRMNWDVLINEALSRGFDFLAVIVTTGEDYVVMGVAKLIVDGKTKLLRKPYSVGKLLEIIKAIK